MTTATLVTADGTTTELEGALLNNDELIWLAALLDWTSIDDMLATPVLVETI